MSWQAATWATKTRVGDVALKLLLLTLANYANQDGEVWHSQQRLSYDTEIPERTLRRKLQALETLGLIEITGRTREDGTRSTNLIRLLATGQAMADGPVSSTGQNGGSPPAKTGGQPPATWVAEQDSSGNNKNPQLREYRAREAETFFEDTFWPEVPRRDGRNPKEPCRKKIVAAIISGENPDLILEGIRRLAQFYRARREVGTRFVPMAVTWANQKGWRDDPMPDQPPPSPPGGGGRIQQGSFFSVAAEIRGTRESER